MRRFRFDNVLVVLLMLSALLPVAASAGGRESDAAFDARMRWWREARFGMFVHWTTRSPT